MSYNLSHGPQRVNFSLYGTKKDQMLPPTLDGPEDLGLGLGFRVCFNNLGFNKNTTYFLEQ